MVLASLKFFRKGKEEDDGKARREREGGMSIDRFYNC